MLPLALAAWSGALRAARAMATLFGACGALLCAVSVFALRVLTQPASIPWQVFAIAAQALATLWVQAVLVRAVLRHLMVGDEGGAAALLPGGTLRRTAGAVVLADIMAAGSPALLLATLVALNPQIGPVSTCLSVPLLLPLALLAMAGALRLGLAPAPAALGLSAPLADSWDITEGHVLFMAGTFIIALGPLMIVMAAAAGALPGAGFGGVAAALALTASWLALSGAQGGLMVVFYQRWQSVLRPDMRPSRNRARRLEPVVGD